MNFNPHEREARDSGNVKHTVKPTILIHTSAVSYTHLDVYKRQALFQYQRLILIHTSVKLVTNLFPMRDDHR